METWTERIFLTGRALLGVIAAAVLTAFASVFAMAAEQPLIEPDVRPSVVDQDLIDTEDFELGLFAGLLNIEDFGSSSLYGARLAYHLSEGLFFELNVGQAKGGETSFEQLGHVQLLSDDDRNYRYYNFNLGYNLLPGQAFVGRHYAFTTNFYLVAGAGTTDFAGDKRLTYNFGAGYQVLLNDWLAVQVTWRQHVYAIDVTGEDKNSFNSEFSSGISVFF